jgi:hypothetical protein
MSGTIWRALEKNPVGPLSVLENNYGKIDSMVFPVDLENIGHWVAFRAGEHKGSYDNRNKYMEHKETLGTVFLPLPAQLGTGYNAGYSQEGIGFFGIKGAEAGGDVVRQLAKTGDIGGSFETLKKNLTKVNTGDLKTGLSAVGLKFLENDVARALGAGVGGIVGGLPGAVGTEALTEGIQGGIKGAMMAGGVAVNPHIATIFTDTKPRTHSFSYKFIPKSEDESNIIQDIIVFFKTHMLPDYIADNHFFEYPNQFDIDFSDAKYLFNISRSVLTSFNVGYHGEGGPFYFETSDQHKAPVSITFDLQFLETTVTTRKDVAKGSARFTYVGKNAGRISGNQ